MKFRRQFKILTKTVSSPKWQVLYIMTQQKISMDCPTYMPQSKKATAADARKSNDIRLQQYARCHSKPNTNAYLSCKKDIIRVL